MLLHTNTVSHFLWAVWWFLWQIAWYKLWWSILQWIPQCALRPLGKHHCGLDRLDSLPCILLKYVVISDLSKNKTNKSHMAFGHMGTEVCIVYI